MVAWLAYKSKCKDSVSLFSFGHKFGSVWTTQPTRALDASKKNTKKQKMKENLICVFFNAVFGFTFSFFSALLHKLYWKKF